MSAVSLIKVAAQSHVPYASFDRETVCECLVPELNRREFRFEIGPPHRVVLQVAHGAIFRFVAERLESEGFEVLGDVASRSHLPGRTGMSAPKCIGRKMERMLREARPVDLGHGRRCSVRGRR